MRTSRVVLYACLCALGLLACEDSTAPATGALRVVASTSGVDLDMDGYAIRVDTGVFHTLEPNGSILIEGLATGLRQVRVDSLATNCALATIAAVFSVAIVGSDTVEVALDVQCASNVGSISVLPGILGPDPDTTFFLSVDGGPPEPMTRLGTLLNNIPAGVHSLSLTGIASNCSPQTSEATATVRFNQTTLVQFNLSCTQRTGRIEVVTSTTGSSIDTDGYDVEVPSAPRGHAPSNGSLMFFNIREGDRFVTLRGLKTNCSVTGSNPRLATVVFGETTVVSFDITCVPPGSVRVAVATTGPDADATYRVVINGSGLFSAGADLPGTGDVTIPELGPGAFVVTLEDVAVNCDVGAGTPNPKPVVVTSGATTDVSFDIACATASQIAFARWSTESFDIFTIKSSGRLLTLMNLTKLADEIEPSFSPDGSRIAINNNTNGNDEIYVMNADGTQEVRLTNHPAQDLAPAWSPDGTRIAFGSYRDGNSEIYVMKADGSDVTRLTNLPAFDGDPTWSPDGSKIAFASNRSGTSQIWVMNADGSNPVRITNTTGWDFSPAWSPDGTRIAFSRRVGCGYYYYEDCASIALMNPDGSNLVMFESSRYDTGPAWSRDSRWIAFQSSSCDYYSCGFSSLSAVKRDGTRRVIIVEGEAYHPTWRP